MKAPAILIVDDNQDTLRTFSKALRRRIQPPSQFSPSSDFIRPVLEIICINTVHEALESLRTSAIDVVIVDLYLPGSNGEALGGEEIIAESLNLDPLRPVIVITGYGTLKLARSKFAQGVFDFIDKTGDSSPIDELVAAVQRAFDRQAEKLLRSGNPFTPMAGIQPRVFGGRTKELEFFEQRLNRAINAGLCEHFVLLGQWGIGKSTLLKEYKKICRSRGHIACIVPLEAVKAGSTLSEVAHSLVEGILRDLPFPVQRFKRLTELFRSFGLSFMGMKLDISRAEKREFLPQAFLHDTFVNLWEDIKEKTGALIILLDDLDNFQPVSEIVMTLRQTLSMEAVQQSRILLGMASSPGMWKGLISSDAHHPLARYFLARTELQPFTGEETRDVIVKCLGSSYVSFAPNVIDKICAVTRGHPFEVQVLCNYLFDNQLSGRVDMEVWDRSLEATLRDVGEAIFDRWLDVLSGQEQMLLCRLAGLDDTFSLESITELAVKDGLFSNIEEIPRIIDKLCSNSILVRLNRSAYSFYDQMFGTYLRSGLITGTKGNLSIGVARS